MDVISILNVFAVDSIGQHSLSAKRTAQSAEETAVKFTKKNKEERREKRGMDQLRALLWVIGDVFAGIFAHE